MGLYLVHEGLSLLFIPQTFPSSSGCALMPVVLHYVALTTHQLRPFFLNLPFTSLRCPAVLMGLKKKSLRN